MLQKGATSIIITILLLSVILVVGLTIAFLMLNQVRMSSQSSQSVAAFYAADAGAEACLYDIRKNEEDCSSLINIDLDSGAQYTVEYDGLGQITSVGHFGITSRKVQLNW